MLPVISLPCSMVRYLHEAGYTVNGQIGCTQPRRVAAVLEAKFRVNGKCQSRA